MTMITKTFTITLHNVYYMTTDDDVEKFCQDVINLKTSPKKLPMTESYASIWKLLGQGDLKQSLSMYELVLGEPIKRDTAKLYIQNMHAEGKLERVSHGVYKWVGE